MNSVKNIDFKKSTQLQQVNEVLKATNIVGCYVIDNITEISSDWSFNNIMLDKELKAITELKVFAEYLKKLQKKLFEQKKQLIAEEELNTDFVPY